MLEEREAPSISESSQRLRYEAFAEFAQNISQTENLSALAQVLGSKLKYMLEVFQARFCIQSLDQTTLLVVDRGRGYWETENPSLLSVEQKALQGGVPIAFAKEELDKKSWWKNSPLHNPLVQRLAVFPMQANQGYQQLITLTSKEPKGYKEVDFRFIKLIGQFVMNKAIQLRLQRALKDTLMSLDFRSQQVEQLNDELEAKVALRTRELRAANDELSTLFYRTSHNFNRPLTTALGLLQLVELREKTTFTEFTHIRNSLGDLQNMLAKLGLLSLLDIQEWEQQIVNLSQEVADLFEDIEKEYPDRALVLHNDVLVDLEIRIPHEFLYQILWQLVENSVRYGAHVDSPITINARATENGILISVADDGLGVHLDMQDKIFDLYFRGGHSQVGNGLGLYVVRRLVQHLNGLICIESDGQSGTVVCFWIPQGPKPS